MVIFRNALDDLGIVVGGSIGFFLPGKRDDDAGIVLPQWRQLVGLLPCPNIEARPLSPQIDPRSSFDDIGDVGAADAGRDFQEIEVVVGMRFQEFRMGDAANKTRGRRSISG